MHPIMVLAFILLAAVALLPISYLVLAPDIDAVQVYVGPSHGGPADGAAPNRDPQHAGVMPSPAAGPVATLATPNHDARHLHPIPFLALNKATLRAEPEPAATDLIAQQIVASQQIAPQSTAPSAPDFVAIDTPLYAKGSARLRAAPSTESDVQTKLTADTPLRATARSTDGVWWRVSLADGRVGYVRQDAVTQARVVKMQPPPQPAPVAAAARPSTQPQPEWQRQSQDLFRYVDKTMNWLADQAGGGTAPKIVRSER
jgi:hypothetical protein